MSGVEQLLAAFSIGRWCIVFSQLYVRTILMGKYQSRIRGGSSSVTLNPNALLLQHSSAEPGKLSETPYETPDETSDLVMIPRLVGPLSKEVLSCVPLAVCSTGEISFRRASLYHTPYPIAFNSYRVNLLAV